MSENQVDGRIDPRGQRLSELWEEYHQRNSVGQDVSDLLGPISDLEWELAEAEGFLQGLD